ncbi:MAG: SulP family inorganic anion transporter, partial [Candidatus Promineifilaceae bacterium]
MLRSSVVRFNRSSLIVALSNALTIGLLEVLWWVAMLALIFAGPLSIYVGQAAIFMIAGAVIVNLIAGLRSSWLGVISMPQDVPSAILVVITSRIMGSVSAETDLDTLFITIVATIGISSVVMGLVFYLLGTFHLGNLVRFIPFPVMGGFLGGTGWLLLHGGITSALGAEHATGIFEPVALLHWLPMLFLSFLIYFASTRIKQPLLVPTMMVVAIGVFFGITTLLGYSLAELTEAGWLIGRLPGDGAQLRLFTLAELGSIQWGAIWRESGSLIVLAIASAIAMLLNNSGFELSVNADFDPSHDLKITGLGNVLAGLLGGWPSYMTPAWSLLNSKDNKQNPLGAPLSAIASGILLWNATKLLAFLPRFVAGAAIGYLGVVFLIDWVILPAKRLAWIEYAMLLFVVSVIAFFGLLEGVAAGLVMAVILFVINYARVSVLRHRLSGTYQQSRVTRPAAHRDYLRENGEQTQILQLHGYVFFGTANSLFEEVKVLVKQNEVRYLVLDFDRVSGVDSTARLSFTKIQQFLARDGIQLLLTAISAESATQLKQNLSTPEITNLHLFDTLDQALQWSEDCQLHEAGIDPAEAMPTLEQQLCVILPEATNIKQL